MKKYYKIIIILIVIALGIGYWIGSSTGHPANTHQSEEKATVWTCSMHPQIQLPEFGQCPICFMDLIPLDSDDSVSEVELKLSKSAMKLAEIGTTLVSREVAEKHIRFSGKLGFDETKTNSITAWTDGRIDKLFIDFVGVEISNNDKLMEIYSPELISAQQEYLLSVGTAMESITSEKLRLLGISSKQISEIKSNGKILQTISITAPISGTVVELNIAEGDYVKTGSPIATVSDLRNLWLNIDVHESDISLIQINQNVTFLVDAYPGDLFEGLVSFIHPTMNSKTRTVSVRVNVDNSNNQLKPEMFVSAQVQVRLNAKGEVISNDDDISANPLIVPSSAVMKTGERAIVYVMKPNTEEPVFELREVTLGHRIQDEYIILDGLSEGENVVSHGTFKIDSAMQLEAKPSMMSGDMNDDEKVVVTISDKLLAEVLHHYFSLQEYLAIDDFDSAYMSTMGIHRLTMGVKGVEPIMEPTMRPNQNISELRNSFREISEVIRQIVREKSINLEFEERFCPAPDGGYWLQKSGKVKNPYFGKEMIPCHAEITWENQSVNDENK
ncbi:MAG: efflux RND transporter periplasmic adaptor subunit [Candidatus Marinimicrobia bacterium]|nr:efflux RND transporter periplasmic adaptor subunit [Candidatus Neomarinimicrobiota bacterium]MBL7022439.1 efflux RND transporter periplasmic adaptor subunit [Candidatus Neomarinimicrobiota bacterium]MBL7108706.1 efflux RND transporter periplasmic adaptor subunit [Candidatus Neomarinimicrobiota bacterium]